MERGKSVASRWCRVVLIAARLLIRPLRARARAGALFAGNHKNARRRAPPPTPPLCCCPCCFFFLAKKGLFNIARSYSAHCLGNHYCLVPRKCVLPCVVPAYVCVCVLVCLLCNCVCACEGGQCIGSAT